MKMCERAVLMTAVGMVLPQLLWAQSNPAGQIESLQGVLEQLYSEMLPMCSKLISVGQGIAGFAATWYIASRVWRHIANAEPIDFYPLFRPFVLGFCVIIFPSVIAMINGVMQPTVSATSEMVKGSEDAIARLLKEKEEALKGTNDWQMYVGDNKEGDRERWYKYTHDGEDPSDEGIMASIGNDIRFAMSKSMYNFRNSVKEWMSEILQILFQAAALCINTLRTFQLIVLAILGPLVFGIAVFDGFQHTLTSWIARYINVFLWLPVANIFGAIIGKVQELMLKADLSQIHDSGQTFFSSTDVGYLVFMVIGIVGYFTVPSVANSIVNAGGGGALLSKTTTIVSAGGSIAQSAGMNAGSRGAETLGNMAGIPGYINEGYHSKDRENGGFMKDKLSGNS